MIPSLLQIPSAVSDSKLHSVLPNNGKGDFTFDRSTGATRINKDGLIEEVGYFSSELVQNGNFSELGSDVVIDGGFSNGLNSWVSEGVELAEGGVRIESDGSTGSFIKQAGILTLNKTYKLVFEVKGVQQTGSLRVGFASLGVANITDIGTYTIYFVANGSEFQFVRNSAINVIIDNVSVKQVDPNDRWSLVDIKFTGAKTFENTATNGRIFQSFTTIVGSKYKVSATINSGTWNVVASTNNNTSGQIVSTGNTTTSEFFEFTATTTTSFLALYNIGASGSVASITNISVVEVQGDRPRLSYDITNGVVEDKPHLLLEPSSTNLITFSEDFSQSAWGKGDAQILSATHKNPDGTTNAKVLAYNGGTNQHYMNFSPSVSSGQNYTFSVFVKAKELKFVCLIFLNGVAGRYFDLENGTVLGTFGATPTNSKIEYFGNGWYRCSITDSATSTTKFSGVYLSENGTSIDSITPTTTNGVYVWGAMMEQQSYATSYIPTAGTTITRAAETCNNSKPSVNSTEGVLYAEIAALVDGSNKGNRGIAISDGTSSQRVLMRFNNAEGVIQVFTTVGTTQGNMSHNVGDTKDYHKVAMKYKENDFSMFVDGTKVNTDTTGSVSSAGTLNVINFDEGFGSNDFYGKVKGLAVYNEALSESQLMQLTGVTASSIYNNFVTRTASFTVEALNEVKKVIDNL